MTKDGKNHGRRLGVAQELNGWQVILRVLHATTVIPESYLDHYIVSTDELAEEHWAMSDLHADVIFPTHKLRSVIFR